MRMKSLAPAVALLMAGALAWPAAQAIAAGPQDTLCVTEAGTVKARSSCASGETPFRVVDGQMHETPLQAKVADAGRNSAASATKYATGGEFRAEESVETAARAFTKKWLLPEGWTGKIVDSCPADMVPISGNVYFPGFDPRYMPQGLSKTLGMPTVLIESHDGGPTRDLTAFTTQVCAPKVNLEANQS